MRDKHRRMKYLRARRGSPSIALDAEISCVGPSAATRGMEGGPVKPTGRACQLGSASYASCRATALMGPLTGRRGGPPDSWPVSSLRPADTPRRRRPRKEDGAERGYRAARTAPAKTPPPPSPRPARRGRSRHPARDWHRHTCGTETCCKRRRADFREKWCHAPARDASAPVAPSFYRIWELSDRFGAIFCTRPSPRKLATPPDDPRIYRSTDVTPTS